MRSRTTPALITLTASRDSPPAPREADGGPVAERKPCAHLHRSTTRMRPAHRKAALDDRCRQRLRATMWCSRMITQPCNAPLFIPRKPFVTGPPAHAELPAHRRKRILLLLSRDQS